MLLDDSIKEEVHACRGCAAKLSDKPLKAALEKADLGELWESPEDSNFLGYLKNGQSLIQSVDGFPALVSDAWLNGRLTALHACSDILASGASVVSAQAIITLPAVSINLQKELLAQSLAGINSALLPQGAKILGGHTLESRKRSPSPISLGVDISLSVNGVVGRQEAPWIKSGLRPGDHILISRALGTGVIFAAAMQGKVASRDLDAALVQMNTSQHRIIDSLLSLQRKESSRQIVHACTDITGFGLLGHLAEMLRSTNHNRSKTKSLPLKISLNLEAIPALDGVFELFKLGFNSTLAPANRNFLNYIKPNYDKHSQIELALEKIKVGSFKYKMFLELLVDPQTCGPIVISCSEEFANNLIITGPWKVIGKVV